MRWAACEWSTNWGSSVHLHMTFSLAECYFSHAEELLHFTVSCTSTAMPFFLSSASTDGSIRSRRVPVPSTRISAGKIKVKRASSLFALHLLHWTVLQTVLVKISWNRWIYLKWAQYLFHCQLFCCCFLVYLFLVQSYGKVRHSPLWCLHGCRSTDMEKHRRKPRNTLKCFIWTSQ